MSISRCICWKNQRRRRPEAAEKVVETYIRLLVRNILIERGGSQLSDEQVENIDSLAQQLVQGQIANLIRQKLIRAGRCARHHRALAQWQTDRQQRCGAAAMAENRHAGGAGRISAGNRHFIAHALTI